MSAVAEAYQAAAEARRKAELAEYAAVHDLAEPDAAAVTTAREQARIAQLRAEAAHTRQAQAEASARLAALEALGADVDELAGAAAGDELVALLATVASAAEAVRTAARQHNVQVAALAARATDLRTEQTDQDGPRPSSGYVSHIQRGQIRHRGTEVRSVPGAEVARAIAAAADADMTTAAALITAVKEHQPRKMDHTYMIITSGELIHSHGDPGGELLERLIDGQISEIEGMTK
jgi:hypothetical protein